MLLNALSFLTGVMLVQQLAELPDLSILLSFLAISFIAMMLIKIFGRRFSQIRPIAFRFMLILVLIISGASWVSLHGRDYLDHKLPEKLAGQEFYVEGVVQDIPVVDGFVQRFVFDVEKAELEDKVAKFPERLRLSWYYGSNVKAGEHWRFLVRLKPPHGFFNPGGFDYEGWLYGQGIHATGYIRKSNDNAKLSDASMFSLDSLRQQISTDIQLLLKDEDQAGLITALAVGDRSPINNEHWDTLIRTGTNHLMAISGLHIGLAAAFGYWLVRRLVPVALMKVLPAQQLSMMAGLAVAVIYALLAGLSIPTQRALIMLICIVGMLLFKRNASSINALSVALLAILLWDPVSVISPGFWFSFLAVAVIFYVFSGRLSLDNGWRARIHQWGWMQLSIALALFPFSVFLFQQTSLVSPLANLILVPYVSFLVVPLVLLALLLMPVSALLSGYVFITANKLLDLIWPVIEALSLHPSAYWVQATPEWPVLILAMAGVVLILAPKGLPGRWLGGVMLLPIILNTADKPNVGDFEAVLLDVGQGLSTVVRTNNHTLVFDAGNRFGSRLDAGKSVVIPFLRYWSVDKLDKLVISHGDADHIGGAQAVVDAYPDVELTGRDIESIRARNKHACHRGQRWKWDGVEFEFLHPDETSYARRNNHSCVLKVSNSSGSLLITSDIETEVEQELIRVFGEKLQADVLVVPHHGSKTSSSQLFINTVKPEIALLPVGYRNRYHHPKAAIIARYSKRGASIHHTGHVGAVKVLFKAQQAPAVVSEYRKSKRKYWNHVIAD